MVTIHTRQSCVVSGCFKSKNVLESCNSCSSRPSKTRVRQTPDPGFWERTRDPTRVFESEHSGITLDFIPYPRGCVSPIVTSSATDIPLSWATFSNILHRFSVFKKKYSVWTPYTVKIGSDMKWWNGSASVSCNMCVIYVFNYWESILYFEHATPPSRC